MKTTPQAKKLANEVIRSNSSDWYDGLEALAAGEGGRELKGLASKVLDADDLWDLVEAAELKGHGVGLCEPRVAQFVLNKLKLS